MSREHGIGQQQAQQQDGEREPEGERASLPPEVHTRVRMLGPQHAQELGELLCAHPELAQRILAVASPRVGMAATKVAVARSYNRQHARHAAQFNAATDRQMLGPDGELDPIAVWHWQEAHGLASDGCVGPASAAAATRETQAADREAPVEAAPVHEEAQVHATPAATDNGMQAGGTAEVTTAPVAQVPAVTARADTGGIGSQARRSLASGSAVEAFKLLTSDNDRGLTANLADYGTLDEQRALLDAVIDQGDDAALIKVAFHAYWHVQVDGLDARSAAQSWPTPVLRSIHHQLKVLPDKDARAGAWTKLSLKNTGGSGRGWWGSNNFSITGNSNTWATDTWKEGYTVGLSAPVPAGATELQVAEAGRFKVGDKLALHREGAGREVVTVAAISGNTYTLAAPTRLAHDANATLDPDNPTAGRQVNWLDYTVRHEIAHSLDGGAVKTEGFYALGGWKANSPYSLDMWVTEMGGASARQGNGISIPDDMPKGTPESQDRSWYVVKLALSDAIARGAKSLFAVKPALLAYQGKGIPVIEAIEAALGAGRTFYNTPTSLYAANGRRFSINFEQNQIQDHSEAMLNDRVTNYSTAAPAEFFAETYAVFYEEAGKPGVTDADHGRLIRNESWRGWMREHVHNRGHAPAGTGAARPSGGHAGGEAELEAGAHDEGAKRGKKTSESGL